MFEIRNYHFEPSLFDEYRPWAESGIVPFLKKENGHRGLLDNKRRTAQN